MSYMYLISIFVYKEDYSELCHLHHIVIYLCNTLMYGVLYNAALYVCTGSFI